MLIINVVVEKLKTTDSNNAGWKMKKKLDCIQRTSFQD